MVVIICTMLDILVSALKDLKAFTVTVSVQPFAFSFIRFISRAASHQCRLNVQTSDVNEIALDQMLVKEHLDKDATLLSAWT